MQYTIKFKCDNLMLPIHYNHIIQGFIYKNIFDDNFREFLHEKGFELEGKSFKLFTFSQLQGNYIYDGENKVITFTDEVELTVSSVIDDFNNEFLKTLIYKKDLKLNNQPVEVSGIVVKENNIKAKRAIVQTLSPITVYSTVHLNGKKKTVYYFPEDSLFQKYIRKNLIRKARLIYNKSFEKGKFEIKPVEGKITRKNLYFKQFIVKGTSGIFEICGDEELIATALNCGLGSKNSQGFGCIKLIKVI